MSVFWPNCIWCVFPVKKIIHSKRVGVFFLIQTQDDIPIVSFHSNICFASVPPLLRRVPQDNCDAQDRRTAFSEMKMQPQLRLFTCGVPTCGSVAAEGGQGQVAAVASKGLNKDHHIFMHLPLLTDEKCQLSCFYFGVFALFIWFISAWALLALTAARPVLPAPEFFRLIWFGAPRRWARWLTCSLTPGAQQLPSLVFQRSPPRTTLACCLSAGLRLPVHGGERHTRLHTHMHTQKRGKTCTHRHQSLEEHT